MIFNMGGSGTNLSGTTATTDDIRKGKTAGNVDGIVTGTMEEVSGGTFTPGTANQVISGKKYLLSDVIVKGDPDLIPENIRSGIDLFGVVGKLSEGKSGIDFGEVTLSSRSEKISVTHNLGVTPSFAIILPKNLDVHTSGSETRLGVNSYSYSIRLSNFYGESSVIHSDALTADNKTLTWERSDTYSSSSNWLATTYLWFAVAY